MTIFTVYTAEQIELMTFIENENQAFRDQAEANGHTVITTTVSDPLHWAGYDIYTVEQYKHADAQSHHYDLYKEVNGIRPRWYAYSEMTVEQINKEIDYLYEEIEAQQKFEAEIKKAEEEAHQERKRKNSYKPNLAFSGLKDALKAA